MARQRRETGSASAEESAGAKEPNPVEGPAAEHHAAHGAPEHGVEKAPGKEAEPEKGKRGRFSLANFDSWATTVRSIFLNALFLVAIVVLVPVLISQFHRDQVVIEPIGVPEELEKQGLTPDIAASRVWDGLQDVEAEAKTSKEKLSAIPQSRRVEFSFPDSGFSIESLIFHVRRLFNAYETRVSGEFTCAEQKCEPSGLRLRLRIIRGDDVEIIDLPPIGEEPQRTYFADAAAHVMATLDPFIAIAADADREPLRATTLARRLIRTHHKDSKWAYNLVGLIRVNANDAAASVADFRAAIDLDPGFLPARANLGNVLVRAGDLAGAQAEFDEIHRRAPGDVRAMEGYADLARAKKDADGAVDFLLKAADLDPTNPHYFAKAGSIRLGQGRKDDGIALLKRSLELDPGYFDALTFLAATYLGDGNYEEGEKLYRDAADYSPNDAAAQATDGSLLAVLNKWDLAAQRYDRAKTLDPGNADYWLQYGICQQNLGKQPEAIEALGTAQKLAPDNAEIYVALGNSYRDTGRKVEAVAAYRKFLDLDKTNSPQRPIVEKFIGFLSSGQ